MKNVTSAENLLQLMRNGQQKHAREPQAETVIDGPSTHILGISNLQESLEILNNHEPRLMEAALDLFDPTAGLRAPRKHSLRSIVPHATAAPAFQCTFNISLEQELLIPAPEVHERTSAVDLTSHKGEDPVTGSEDTLQQITQPLQPMQQNDKIDANIPQRPRRRTAQRALSVIQTTEGHHRQSPDIEDPNPNVTRHQSVSIQCQKEIFDKIDDTCGCPDLNENDGVEEEACFVSKHRALPSPSSAAINVSNRPRPSRASSKTQNTNRPLQRKSYDGLVDPHLPPDEVRRMRRILSNRESARRCRKRKASQISSLEEELMEFRMAATEAQQELAQALTRIKILEAQNAKLVAEIGHLKSSLSGNLAVGNAMSVPVVMTSPQLVGPLTFPCPRHTDTNGIQRTRNINRMPQVPSIMNVDADSESMQPSLPTSTVLVHFESPLRQLGQASMQRIRF